MVLEMRRTDCDISSRNSNSVLNTSSFCCTFINSITLNTTCSLVTSNFSCSVAAFCRRNFNTFSAHCVVIKQFNLSGKRTKRIVDK